MNLYTDHAEEFDKTRQSPWDGWFRLDKEYFKNKNILDLGCGNGRFLKFLIDEKIEFNTYTGIDYSDLLLSKAKKLSEGNGLLDKCKFNKIDLLADWSLEYKYDCIVSFGFTHHLIDKRSQDYFFTQISNILNKNGCFIVTFWDFKKLKVFDKAKYINENLYELPFGNNAVRDCYYFSDEYIKELFNNNSFNIVSEFNDDSITKIANKYILANLLYN